MHPIGAALVLLLFRLVGSGAAMVIGSILRTEQQAGAIGVLLGIGLAAIGGSMMPMELFSPAMRAVAHLTPHAWGNDAFTELIRRDGGVADIMPELGVLAGYGVVLFAVGAVLLRRTLARGPGV